MAQTSPLDAAHVVPLGLAAHEASGGKHPTTSAGRAGECRVRECHDVRRGMGGKERLAAPPPRGAAEVDASRPEREGEGAAACRRALAEAQQKVARMERDYAQVLNETWTDVEELEDKAKRQARTIKSKEERYQDTRRQVSRGP